MLPTGFGKSIIFQLYFLVLLHVLTSEKPLRSCEGMSSKYRCFAFVFDHERSSRTVKRPGFSAAAKGIGKESDENEEKLLSLFAKLFSEAVRAGFPNYG